MIKRFIIYVLIICLHVKIYSDEFNLNQININILSDKDVDVLKIIETNINHSGRNAAISIVSDGIHTYIMKQIKNNDFHSQLSLVKETIVSAVGSQYGIHVDKNYFIPYNVGENIKIYKDRAATLHLYVQGKSLHDCLPEFLPKDFRLSQLYRPYVYEYKHGFENEYGFNEITIKSMSLHKDLPGIVALDTFFCNFDRDADNIIYNEEIDSFYGIDQGSSFAGSLPYVSIIAYHQCINLELSDYFSTCDSNIIIALRAYKNHLKNLCENKPDDIAILFKKLIPYLQNKCFMHKDMKSLNFYIHQSHKICSNIVDLLEKF